VAASRATSARRHSGGVPRDFGAAPPVPRWNFGSRASAVVDRRLTAIIAVQVRLTTAGAADYATRLRLRARRAPINITKTLSRQMISSAVSQMVMR
jgi:hypothetical protein